MQPPTNRRILIIDDNPSIHEDVRKILGRGLRRRPALDAAEAGLFGEQREQPVVEPFQVHSASQGAEGLESIVTARQQNRPFALAFVDLRMPPGWDGVETVERAWLADPDIQFVICSAYSDYSAGDILQRLGISDRLLMLRKPCDMAEILLMASALCHKWNLARASEHRTDQEESDRESCNI